MSYYSKIKQNIILLLFFLGTLVWTKIFKPSVGTGGTASIYVRVHNS